MSELDLQLQGYRLTTAEIIYRRPDHPSLLQEYIWQDLDLAPKFPRLKDFLAFWEANLDGPLYSVTVASNELLQPSKLRPVDAAFDLVH